VLIQLPILNHPPFFLKELYDISAATTTGEAIGIYKEWKRRGNGEGKGWEMERKEGVKCRITPHVVGGT